MSFHEGTWNIPMKQSIKRDCSIIWGLSLKVVVGGLQWDQLRHGLHP